jgi:hypothetical protein
MENQPEATEPTQTKKTRSKFTKALMLLGFAGVVGMGAGIFAANIGVNTTNGGQIEFGTGTAVISTCIDSVELELVTAFDASDSKFYLNSLTLDIYDSSPADCAPGTEMMVDVMSTAGVSLITVGATPTVTLAGGADQLAESIVLTSEAIETDDIGYVLLETSN